MVRKVFLNRISAKDPDGRFCHYIKSCETEDVYQSILRQIYRFNPFSVMLKTLTLAKRVLLLD